MYLCVPTYIYICMCAYIVYIHIIFVAPIRAQRKLRVHVQTQAQGLAHTCTARHYDRGAHTARVAHTNPPRSFDIAIGPPTASIDQTSEGGRRLISSWLMAPGPPGAARVALPMALYPTTTTTTNDDDDVVVGGVIVVLVLDP